MEEAERLCDRVGIMDRGKMLALDTVPALLTALGGMPTLVVESADGEERIATDDPVAELNRRFPSGRADRFRLERANLERVFLNLTGKHLRD
jgi:ABC-2 type transport system ATP-binding protein